MPHKISISNTGPISTGPVILDGHNIADVVQRIRVDLDAGRPSHVELTLNLVEVQALDCEQAEILLAPEHHEVLTRLGWTPPADALSTADLEIAAVALEFFRDVPRREVTEQQVIEIAERFRAAITRRETTHG